MSETIPTIFMFEDRIVEIGYTEWDYVGGDDESAWAFRGTVDFVMSADINRVVVELPVGCYEFPTYVSAGCSLTLTDNTIYKSQPLVRCLRVSETADAL